MGNVITMEQASRRSRIVIALRASSLELQVEARSMEELGSRERAAKYSAAADKVLEGLKLLEEANRE